MKVINIIVINIRYNNHKRYHLVCECWYVNSEWDSYERERVKVCERERDFFFLVNGRVERVGAIEICLFRHTSRVKAEKK